MKTMAFISPLAALPLMVALLGALPSHGEGNAPIWNLTEPIPFGEQPDISGLGLYERAELSASQQQIIKAIIGIAKNFDYSIIAEGVEDPVQAEFLNSLGCTMMQGYLYGKPMRVEEFITHLFQVNRLSSSTGNETTAALIA
jgi:EAL domain